MDWSSMHLLILSLPRGTIEGGSYESALKITQPVIVLLPSSGLEKVH